MGDRQQFSEKLPHQAAEEGQQTHRGMSGIEFVLFHLCADLNQLWGVTLVKNNSIQTDKPPSSGPPPKPARPMTGGKESMATIVLYPMLQQ